MSQLPSNSPTIPSQRLGPLRLCHINAQPMINKTDEIQHFLTTRSIRVCSINETWLHPSKTLNFRNFQIFRRDRLTQGGGVCLLIHNSILCEQLIFPFSQIEEILAIRLHGVSKDKQDIVVATYYNPPQATFNPVPLQSFLDQHHRMLIVSDLNAHHLLWGSRHNCHGGEAIAQLMLDADLALLNKDQATYCPVQRPEYSATLDLATNTTTTIRSIDWPEFVEQATKAADSLDQTTQLTTKEGIDLAVSNLTDAISRAPPPPPGLR